MKVLDPGGVFAFEEAIDDGEPAELRQNASTLICLTEIVQVLNIGRYQRLDIYERPLGLGRDFNSKRFQSAIA